MRIRISVARAWPAWRNPARQASAIAAMLALCSTIVACGGSDGVADKTPDGAFVGAQGTDGDARSRTGSRLAWNECPIDLATVDAMTGLNLNNDDSPCAFRDGVRLITINVLGAHLDPRDYYQRRGFQIVDVDRGDYGFVGIKDIEAQAHVVVGDLSLSIGMLGFDLDAAGYRTLALKLIDASLGQ